MSVYTQKPWLNSYEEGVPAHIEYEAICLPEILEKTVRDFPENKALIFEGYTVTYRELKEMVERFATCLADLGVKKGDRVAILLPNLIPCVVAYYAILRLGAIVVMNNPLYTDRELKYQFNNSGTKTLITLDLLANRMIALRPKTEIRDIIYTSIGDYLPFPKNIFFPLVARKKKLAASVEAAPNVYRWKECIAHYRPEPPEVKLDFNDIAMCQYTGGTTGISKGVMLTHANLSKQLQQFQAWTSKTFQRGDGIALGALPFFHVFGLSTAMNLCIWFGWTNILIPKPQSQQLLDAIKRFKPSFAPLVPTMFIGILEDPGLAKVDMTCIKWCFSGSSPLPLEVIRKFEELTGAIIVEGYGLTETSPVTHVNPFAGGVRKVGSIGIPITDTECRIVDLEDGIKDVPVGAPGELIIKGPQVMKGYWNMPRETADNLRAGWCYTGDIAKMDEDGYFTVVDRKKDLIISSGYNVYPRDIDEVLYEHPKVREACAIGIPDPKRGENVKAFIVLREGYEATAVEIIEYCSTKLARYKLPTEIEFRQELPKTSVGKVLRKQLREEELQKRKNTI